MNIIGYVKKFGNLSFNEKPFNDVDALILETLSYLNFEIYSSVIENSSFFLKDIQDKDIVRLCANELTTKYNEKIIRHIKKSKRYKDIEVKYTYGIYDKVNTIQFFAMTLIIPYYHPLICFRGTDLTLVGWKEDLLVTISDVLPSQIEAINYIDYVCKQFEGPISIGGHSKGGNLAIFGATYSREELQNRIFKTYDFDGPGLKFKSIYDDKRYLNVKDKVVVYIPRDDIVGCAYHLPKDKIIIKAKGISFFQHNPYFWKLNKKGEFKLAKKELRRVLVRRKTVIDWVNTMTMDDRNFMIDMLINSLGGVDSTLHNRFGLMLSKIRSYFTNIRKYSKRDREKYSNSLKLFKKLRKENKRYFKTHKTED